MKSPSSITLLSVVIALCGGIAAASGLFWPTGATLTEAFTSVRGEQVTLFGSGLYRFDALILGAGFRGQDVITLVFAAPALLVATSQSRTNGNIAWVVLRLVLVTYFAYAYGSLALSASYNPLFLLYVGTFSASLYGLALATRELHARVSPSWPVLAQSLPRRGPTLLLLLCGVFTGFIWSEPLIAALIGGTVPPLLGHSTTKVTEVLDLAIIVPAAILAAVLIWQRRIDGYLLGIPLLGLLAMLFLTITASTISQLQAGVVFTAPEIAGPIGGFLGFGAWGTFLLWRMVTRLRVAEAVTAS